MAGSRACPPGINDLMTGRDRPSRSPHETVELPRERSVPPPGELPPTRIVPSPPSIHQAHRRPWGLGPVSVLGALGGLTLLLAIILFATAAWVGAVLFLCISVASFSLLPAAVKREWGSEAAQVALTAAERAR